MKAKVHRATFEPWLAIGAHVYFPLSPERFQMHKFMCRRFFCLKKRRNAYEDMK